LVERLVKRTQFTSLTRAAGACFRIIIGGDAFVNSRRRITPPLCAYCFTSNRPIACVYPGDGAAMPRLSFSRDYYAHDGRNALLCVLEPGSEVTCCPNYTVSVDESGTVIYNGRNGQGAWTKNAFSLCVSGPRSVAEFYRIDFFSREDRYVIRSNLMVTLLRPSTTRASTIRLTSTQKKAFIFYGAPQELAISSINCLTLWGRTTSRSLTNLTRAAGRVSQEAFVIKVGAPRGRVNSAISQTFTAKAIAPFRSDQCFRRELSSAARRNR
jgi:hypothetical protein